MVKFDIRYMLMLRSVQPLRLYAYNVFWLRFANRCILHISYPYFQVTHAPTSLFTCTHFLVYWCFHQSYCSHHFWGRHHLDSNLYPTLYFDCNCIMLKTCGGCSSPWQVNSSVYARGSSWSNTLWYQKLLKHIPLSGKHKFLWGQNTLVTWHTGFHPMMQYSHVLVRSPWH